METAVAFGIGEGGEEHKSWSVVNLEPQLRSRLALPWLLRRPLAHRLVLIPCLTFSFLVLSVPLARQVSCPVLSPSWGSQKIFRTKR